MQIVTTKRDITWNYAGTLFSMLGNYLLLPLLLLFLSSEELGLWYVYLAVGSLVMLFEFGFNPTFARNFAFCWSGAQELTKDGCIQGNRDGAVNRQLLFHLLLACKKVYRAISCIAFAVLATVGTAYVFSISENIDTVSVALSWSLYCVGVLINLYYLYYSALLRGIGLIASDNQIKIAARLSQIVLTAVLFYFGFGLVSASIGFLANAAVYRILGCRLFWRNDKIKALNLNSLAEDKSYSKKIFSTISHNAYKDGGVQISNYISTQASSLICASCLGLSEAGEFSIALQFSTAIGSMALSTMNSCRPMLQSAYQQGNMDILKTTFGKCIVIYIGVFALLFAIVLVAAYPLIGLFKPDEYFDPLVFCSVSAYMFLFNWCALFSSMLSNTNYIPYARAYFLSAICGVAASLLLVEVLNVGVWGLIAGIAIPQCVYNVWKWPFVASRRVDSSVGDLLSLGLKAVFRKQSN